MVLFKENIIIIITINSIMDDKQKKLDWYIFLLPMGVVCMKNPTIFCTDIE